ncbi:DBH-like monooxygenase protein 1 homolog [Liolophura sinensis]|uniref:DBH-like monooxygenase protein 1 homolog n=1 Tax=Liolophura sinensis TaxID=3198878 RepID=UPI003159085B
MTYAGLSTREEMCIAFIVYYPKISLSYCTTQPTAQFNIAFRGATADHQVSPNILTPPEYKGKNWKDFFENAINWSDPKVRKDFQEYSLLKDYPVHFALCFDGTKSYPANFKVTSIPSIRYPLEEKSMCGNVIADGAQMAVSSVTLFLITTLVTVIV